MSGKSMDKKDKKKKKSKGQKGNYNRKPFNSFSMGGAPSAPESVWDGKKNVAEALFPVADVFPNDEIIDDDMKKAIEESLRMSQMMEECAIEEKKENAHELAQKEKKVEEESDEMYDDEFSWTKVNRNLPYPDDKEIRKNFDTNNNSGFDKVTNLAIETKKTDHNGCYIIQKSSTGEIPEIGSGCNRPFTINPSCIDQYGRVGGRSEAHMFMGKGARMKEQEVLQQIRQGNSSVINSAISPPQHQGENKIDPTLSTNKNLMRPQTSNPSDRRSMHDQRERQSSNYYQEKQPMNFPQDKQSSYSSQENQSANFTQDTRSMDHHHQQERQLTNHRHERRSVNFPLGKKSSNFIQEKQLSNLSQERRSMNHQRERQSTNHQQERGPTNSTQEKPSSNYQEGRGSKSFYRPEARGYVTDKYHFFREEKLERPEVPKKIASPADFSIRSSDGVVERAKNEIIKPSDETPKNSSEIHDDISKMAVSKLPRLADFHSKFNVPITDENPPTSIYPSDVASNSPSPDQNSESSHYSDASANFSQSNEFAQYTNLFSTPPGFQCMAQTSPLPVEANCIHGQESQYASLRLTDPSLHNVFIQKKNRDCCAHRESCSNYENSFVQVDPTEMMKFYGKHFLTPEEQVSHYDRGMSEKLSDNICSHVTTNYPSQFVQQGISDTMRVDDSVCQLVQETSDSGRENSQMLMQTVYAVPGSDPSVHFPPFANSSHNSQNPLQNVQRSLNLQPMMPVYQNRPPGFENIRANNSSLPIQSLAQPFYDLPPFYPPISGIYGNPSQPQMVPPPMSSHRNYENYGMGGEKNLQNFPNHENRNIARNEIPPLMVQNNSGGNISHNVSNRENFDSRPPGKETYSMIQQRSPNVDILRSRNSPFLHAENPQIPSEGRGRGGRFSRN